MTSSTSTRGKQTKSARESARESERESERVNERDRACASASCRQEAKSANSIQATVQRPNAMHTQRRTHTSTYRQTHAEKYKKELTSISSWII